MAELPEPPTDDEDPRHKAPADIYAGVAPAPLPPIAPDGGFAPKPGPVGPPPPLPAATPDTFLCLRGPCRHHWELVTHLEAGNPALTWDPEIGLKDENGQPVAQPKQHSRTCLVQAGTETDLTEDVVYACSRWDPDVRASLADRPWWQRALAAVASVAATTPVARRRIYLALHPAHARAPVAPRSAAPARLDPVVLKDDPADRASSDIGQCRYVPAQGTCKGQRCWKVIGHAGAHGYGTPPPFRDPNPPTQE
mgnify:CR=1 FL=1